MFSDPELRRKILRKLEAIEAKNVQVAEKILNNGRKIFTDKGFSIDQIRIKYRKKKTGIARDILKFSETRKADAIVLSCHGRSRMESFFMGAISSNLLAYNQTIPIWLINGKVINSSILIGADTSENFLRAADHAGFMLSHSNCPVNLLHSKPDLRRFIPKEVIRASPEIVAVWLENASRMIAPYIKKGRGMLIERGFSETQISAEIIEGSRSIAADILKKVQKNGYGTIVLGRKGMSFKKGLVMGTVTRKVIEDSRGLAVWIIP